MLLPPLLVALPLGGAIHVVDAAGTGDYTQITDAIDAALPGDKLWVLPGTYAPFNLEKDLVIVGDSAEPPKCGPSSVRGAPSFTLRGLEFSQLLIEGVPGRGRIDTCVIQGDGVSPNLFDAGLRVENSGQLAVLRSTILGPGATLGTSCDVAVLVLNGTVGFSDCTAVGGSPLAFGTPVDGCNGMNIGGQSRVVVSGSDVSGSSGSFCNALGCGQGGVGIQTVGSSTLDVRGSSANTIAGGLNGDFLSNQVALVGPGIVHSGTALQGGLDAAVTVADPALPFLSITESTDGLWNLALHGPAGQSVLLALATAPALETLAGLEGLVWISPPSVIATLPLLTFGQEVPLTFPVSLPPPGSFFGSSIEVQGFWFEPGGLRAGNASTLIFDF